MTTYHIHPKYRGNIDRVTIALRRDGDSAYCDNATITTTASLMGVLLTFGNGLAVERADRGN